MVDADLAVVFEAMRQDGHRDIAVAQEKRGARGVLMDEFLVEGLGVELRHLFGVACPNPQMTNLRLCRG
jgi:hypothetical protein